MRTKKSCSSATKRSALPASSRIHSTVLGPAAGGCRIWTYASDEDALTDVLRLSRGMTYKNAMADLPLGGGKAVIYHDWQPIAPPVRKAGRRGEKLWADATSPRKTSASASAICARSPSTRPMSRGSRKKRATPAAILRPGPRLAFSTPSKRCWTAIVRGRTIAVQGVGAVGRNLCELLARSGAKSHRGGRQ